MSAQHPTKSAASETPARADVRVPPVASTNPPPARRRSARRPLIVIGAILLATAAAGVLSLWHVERTRHAHFVASRRSDWDALDAVLKQEIRRFRGDAGVVVVDFTTGFRFAHQPDKAFAAASVVKVAIMAACLQAAEEGKLSLDDPVTLRPADIVSGSGVLKALPAGSVVPTRELMEVMIARSDNTATNLLLGRLGMDYVNAYFAHAGLTNTRLDRVMMDFSKRDQGVENVTTAADTARILERFYRGQVVSPEASAMGIEWLKQQTIRDRIRARLPHDTVVAHKTGLERYVCHDAGIVMTERGDFLICVLTKTQAGSPQAKAFIGRLTRYVYDYMHGERPTLQPLPSTGRSRRRGSRAMRSLFGCCLRTELTHA